MKSSKTPQAGGVAEGKEAGLKRQKKASDLLPKVTLSHIPIIPEETDIQVAARVLDSIRGKHDGRFTSITLDHGRSQVQIFTEEKRLFKGSTQEALEAALA